MTIGAASDSSLRVLQTESGDDQSNGEGHATVLTAQSHALTVRMSLLVDRQVETGKPAADLGPSVEQSQGKQIDLNHLEI